MTGDQPQDRPGGPQPPPGWPGTYAGAPLPPPGYGTPVRPQHQPQYQYQTSPANQPYHTAVRPYQHQPPVQPFPPPARVEPVPGTVFGLGYPAVPPTVAGTAVGSLVAGIGADLVSLLVVCFGLRGAQSGWGLLVSGAFAVLTLFLAAGAAVLRTLAVRQVRASAGQVRGRGSAAAGLWCGVAAIAVTLFALVVTAALS